MKKLILLTIILTSIIQPMTFVNVKAQENSSTGATVTIETKELELPTTIYVIDVIEVQFIDELGAYGGSGDIEYTYSNEKEYYLTDNQSLQALNDLFYQYNEGRNYECDKCDGSDYAYIKTTKRINVIYTTKTSNNYTGRIIPKTTRQNTKTPYTITYNSLDNYSPVVSGKLNYVTNPQNIITLEQIIANISVIDETDGEIELTSNNITLNEYENNQTTLGNHNIVFEVSDKAGNKATLTITIMVIDTLSPIISGPETVNSYMSNSLTIQDIKNLLSVEDDCDDLKVTDIQIKKDDYTENKDKIGEYEIVFSIYDLAGNEGTHQMTINVIDDIKPTITGTSSYQKGSTDLTLTLEKILNDLKIEDNISTLDKSNLNIVKNTYSENFSKVGTWEIILNVKDQAGNTSNDFTIQIQVLDDIAPVFWANNSFFVYVDTSTPLSSSQIGQIAKNIGIIDKKATNIQIISNEYEGNETIEGEYQISVLAIDKNGKESAGSFTLKVNTNYDKLNLVKKTKKKLKWYQKIWKTIKNIFSFKWIK